jgi:hypothetical protein
VLVRVLLLLLVLVLVLVLVLPLFPRLSITPSQMFQTGSGYNTEANTQTQQWS